MPVLESNSAAPIRRTRVYLVDDLAILRAGFRAMLAEHDSIEVVGDSGDPHAAIEAIGELRPDVVLLDITMPELSGVDAIPKIRAVSPKSKFVMLTHHEGERFVDEAMKAGASAYLSKDSQPAELVLAIHSAMKGELFVTSAVAGGILRRLRGGAGGASLTNSRVQDLAPREREILQLLAAGRSNKEIARTLGITVANAKKNRQNLQRKLGLQSTAEMALLLNREGLTES